jgi:hypothetical protein
MTSLPLAAAFSAGSLTVTAAPATAVGAARAEVSGGRIRVTTGTVERVWQWTGKGLVTTSLRDLASGREWASKPSHVCDWDLPGAIGPETVGTLVGTETRAADDDGFSSPHLEIISTIRYEAAKLEIQHVVWAYPDAPGLRVQLRAKALPGFDPQGKPAGESVYQDCGATFPKPSARADYLPLDFGIANQRRYWGCYNNPGNRHDQSQDMLREQIVTGWPIFLREDIDWASGAAVQYGDAGVMLVKESPKTVNQPAHYTGAFHANPAGLGSTGWGLVPAEIVTDRFRECWANWCIVYQGGDDGLQLALKRFDRARYPVFPRRDLFILSNTWGPANPLGGQFTSEEFVMKEIPALADLGVDVMQIDDGWQKAGDGPDAKGFLPKYTHGWRDIKAACDAHRLRLGLWVAIRNADPDHLRQNLDELGFITWKADFDHLGNRADYEARTAAFRAVMKHAWMKTQFTLCPEYDDPRYGWYFAREYGSIYFQNIQESLPAHLTMVPYQVLRQHWLMAKYFPANKLQVMLQNPKRANPGRSDGPAHSHAYCFAMGVPFVPCFFQSAQYLDPEGRAELGTFIALYKQHREAIFTSYTFPIGDEPNNAGWSGFQTYDPARQSDYLILFRELHNQQPKRSLRLAFLAGKRITLTDLETKAERTVRVPADGMVEFEIPNPASYQFIRYSHTL